MEDRRKIKRGLGILPYGNLFRSVGRLNVKNFACVMTQAVLAKMVDIVISVFKSICKSKEILGVGQKNPFFVSKCRIFDS